ncbi:MAG: hypothetical protein GY706_15275 [Bacteroides sp.]|nr:hypothetical protein [Bacteroides sp.]
MQITENYYQARHEAIDWLNSRDRDFTQGVQILVKSGYKPLVSSKIAKWGDTDHSREKLIYEIRQMIQVWANPNDAQFDDADFSETETVGANEVVDEVSAATIVSEAENEKKKENDEDMLPPIVRQIIYEFADSYKSRSILHKEMLELPEDNSSVTVSKRKVIIDSIAALSARMKVLYDYRKQYEENGVVPSQEELQANYHDPDDNDDKKSDSVPVEEVVLPQSVEELKKMRKSEATKLSRARNMLLYQQESKPKPIVENPLPDCPKRVKFQKKADRIEALIKRIDYLIAERS